MSMNEPFITTEQNMINTEQNMNLTADPNGGNGDRNSAPDTVSFVKGENQPDIEYRDKYFAYAFWLQLVSVFTTAVVLGGNAATNESDDDLDNNVSFGGVFALLVITTVGIVAAVVLSMKLMIHYADKGLIEVAFFLAPISYGFGALIVFLMGGSVISFYFLCAAVIFALISFVFYTCYKKYIPYAAATLRTALSALQVNRGLFLLAFGILIALNIWVIVWTAATVGIFQHAATKQVPCYNYNNEREVCSAEPNPFAIIIMVLCFYWTQQVLTNVLHTTTAGTVGCFWFNNEDISNPEGNTLWSAGIAGSFSRAMTYSFGSICFGSLMVAIIETMEYMARQARGNRNGAMVACILECLLRCIRVYIEYFNSWAYCYVGIYGYDYINAGRNVIQLLKNRGWTVIISDRLIFRVLFFIHIAVAGMGGAAAVLADVAIGPIFDIKNEVSHSFSFGIGLVMGLIISSTSLFVIESAVRTIIVCFAESPAEFEENHPQLYQTMMDGWSETYPDIFAEATVLDDKKTSGNLPEARNIV